MFESIGLWLPGAAVMLGIVAASGFFSGSETALFFLSPDDLRTMDAGTRSERAVVRLMADPERLLTAVLFWNLVANLTYFTVGILTARRLFNSGFELQAGLFNVGSLVLIIVFGEVVPKSLAVVAGRRLATLVVTPLATAVRVLDPVRPTLTMFAAAIRRVLVPKLIPEPYLKSGDLDKAAALAGPVASLDRDDARAFRNILDLLEMRAEDLMRPRVYFRPLGPRNVGGQRLPLFLAGQVVVDLADKGVDRAAPAHVAAGDTIDPSALRDLEYVPWCAPAAAAVESLRRPGRVAVGVINEFGDLVGVVTGEDVIESLVSSKASRAGRVLDREPVVHLGNGRWRVEGMTLLRVLGERLGLSDEDVFDEDVEARTVAGLLQERYGRFVETGEETEWLGHIIRVTDTPRPGVIRAEVIRPGSDGGLLAAPRSREGGPQ